MKQVDLSNYRVAVLQMDIRPGKPDENCETAIRMAEQAIARGARLIVTPELSDIDMLDDARDLVTSAPGPYTQPFEDLSRKHGVHCVVGMSRRQGSGFYNSAVFIGPEGILGAYDKVHVWAGDWDTNKNDWAEDPRRIEPNNFLPGDEFKKFEIDGVKVGAMICYDGLFAESWLCNRLLGADMIVWPTNRGNYRDMNIPVMAKYFQLNVLAANRFGQSSYWTQGDSHIVSAMGQVLAHAYNGESVLIADLDILESRRWRRSMPEMRDRRPDVYQKYIGQTPAEESAPGIPSYQVVPLWKR